MTDRIALGLALVITTVVGADFVFDDGSILLFLARKLFVFVEYLSFWRCTSRVEISPVLRMLALS